MVSTNISKNSLVYTKGNTDRTDLTSAAKTQSASGGFADLLLKTTVAGKAVNRKFSDDVKTKNSVDASSKDKSNIPDNYQQADNKNKISDSKIENSDKKEVKDKNSQKTDNGIDSVNPVISDDMAQQVQQLLGMFQNEILKVLNISQEQLQSTLSSMGLNLKDLLQPSNLVDFMNQVSETKEPVALLTDASFAEKWKTLSAFADNNVEQLSQQLDISQSDLLDMIQKSKQNDVAGISESGLPVDIANTNLSDVANKSELVSNNQEQPIKMLQNEHTENDQNVDQLEMVMKDKVTVSTDVKENNSGAGKDFQQKSDGQSGINHITASFTQAVQESFAHISGETMNTTDIAHVVNQIVEAAKVKITPDVTSMDIQLNPENLGKVSLSVIAKEGIITAQLTAENETIKKAIENQLHVLKENFNQQGIKVEAVEVSVASHAFDNSNNFQNGSAGQNPEMKKNKQIKIDSLEELDENELLDEEKSVIHSLNNNSVEYSA